MLEYFAEENQTQKPEKFLLYLVSLLALTK